jgi:hypothetical protein
MLDVKGCGCVGAEEAGKDMKYKANAMETTSGLQSGDTPWYPHSEEAGENAVIALFNLALVRDASNPKAPERCNCQYKVSTCVCRHVCLK